MIIFVVCLVAVIAFSVLGYVNLQILESAKEMLERYLLCDGYVSVPLRKADKIKNKYRTGKTRGYRFPDRFVFELRSDEWFDRCLSDERDFLGYAFMLLAFIFALVGACAGNEYVSYYARLLLMVPFYASAALFLKFRTAYKKQLRKDFFQLLENQPEIDIQEMEKRFEEFSEDDKRIIEMFPYAFEGKDSYYGRLVAYGVYRKWFFVHHPLYFRLLEQQKYELDFF